MEKITFASADSQENEEFFVLEQTKLNGVSYILVTDSEEDDAAYVGFKRHVTGGIIRGNL